MTFAVQINDSLRYVVKARGILGAVKAALDASEALGGTPKEIEAVRIEVSPVRNQVPKGTGL